MIDSKLCSLFPDTQLLPDTMTDTCDTEGTSSCINGSGCGYESQRLWASLLAQGVRLACSLLEKQHVSVCENWADHLEKTCHPQWALLLPAALLCLVLALIFGSVYGWLHGYLTVQQGSEMVAIATATLQELRKVQRDLHPETPHMWFRSPAAEVPMLCGVCCKPMQVLAPGQVRVCQHISGTKEAVVLVHVFACACMCSQLWQPQKWLRHHHYHLPANLPPPLLPTTPADLAILCRVRGGGP